MDLRIETLNKTHLKSDFECGHPALDDYIQKLASQDVARDLTVCYVLRNSENKVLGYYTLSSNAIPREGMPEDKLKKLPKGYKELPATLLGRLAVRKEERGKDYGILLLLDALKRCADVSEIMGTLAVIVDPIDERAERFYKKYDFIPLESSSRMFITMKTIREMLAM